MALDKVGLESVTDFELFQSLKWINSLVFFIFHVFNEAVVNGWDDTYFHQIFISWFGVYRCWNIQAILRY